MNVHTDLISIEYHGQQLEVDGRLLGSYEKMTRGSLFQFLGELERTRSKVREYN